MVIIILILTLILSCVKPNSHIKIVYNDMCKKYKNIDNYKFISVGWSMGGGLAYLFSQMYTSQCIHCIVLDPIYITPHNMKSQLNYIILEDKKLRNSKISNSKLTNATLQRMLYNIQNNYSNEEFEKLIKAIDYIRFLYYSKHINLKFTPLKI